MGTPMVTIHLPSMEKVIGKSINKPERPLIWSENDRMLRWIRGAVGQLGNSRLITVRF